MGSEEGVVRGPIAVSFLADVAAASSKVVATGADDQALPLQVALGIAIGAIEQCCGAGNKIIFVGNGGSAAIASHQAVDYWKNGGLAALAFNDASLLTCISNDFGYERVFAEPITQFGRVGDVLVAISSSGRSRNILQAVEAARNVGCWVMTLSGFEESNALRRMGDLNFYLPSKSYGVVEITHLALLHSMLEESIVSRGRS